MRRAIFALAALAASAPAAVARADASVQVTLNDQGRQLAAKLGLSVPELIQHAEDRIDELYRLSRLDDLLRAFGDTSAFAQRGLGVDYDPDPGDILIGAAAAGIHGDVAIGTTSTLLAGSIVNGAAMIGVNFARWHHPGWTAFASGLYEATTIHGLTGHLLTAGAHVQDRVLPAGQRGRVRWTGLVATAGLEYARWTVGTAGAVESHFTAEGPSDHATVHMSSTGTLDVKSETWTVPLEVTTGVRFWNTLAFYAGGGLDLTAGRSTIDARLDSTLSIDADRIPVGTAVITGSGEHAASPVSAHALAGFAIHTSHVRVFVQGELAPGEEAVGLGLRIAL